MRLEFVDREVELRELDAAAKRGGLYSQAIGAQRYWERNVELDLVAPDPEDRKQLLVAEVKWRPLSAAERKNVVRQLEAKWSHCSLRGRYPRARFEVLDTSMLTG
jgi:hypothetical protein